jgi:hypothetical protein
LLLLLYYRPLLLLLLFQNYCVECGYVNKPKVAGGSAKPAGIPKAACPAPAPALEQGRQLQRPQRPVVSEEADVSDDDSLGMDDQIFAAYDKARLKELQQVQVAATKKTTSSTSSNYPEGMVAEKLRKVISLTN